MNTTIMYSFPEDLKYRYMSFDTYEIAKNCIELFKQIDVRSEIVVGKQAG